MKTKILLALSCLFSLSGFAQDSSFQLKDYKYRTSGFKTLEFSTGFHGRFSDDKNTAAQNMSVRSFDLYPSWINYTNRYSSEKRTHFTSLSLSPAFSSQSQTISSGKVKSTNFQASLQWQLDDRLFGKKNRFFQFGARLYGNENLSKQSTDQLETSARVDGALAEITLGIGKGRIENVNDAQMALYILNDLEQQGFLAAMPDAKTVNEFAQLITAVNNKRVFDLRRRRIFELNRIDSFLRAKEIIPATDIRYFTIINDNWTYAFTPERLSGHDVFLRIQPSFGIGKANQTIRNTASKNVSEQVQHLVAIGPTLGYENYKPLNLKWQRNFGTNILWQTKRGQQTNKSDVDGSTSDSTTKANQKKAQFNAFYGFGYYPNNRTIVNLNLMVMAIRTDYDHSPLRQATEIQPSLSLSADYFISYRTRLTAHFLLYHQRDHLEYDMAPSEKQRLTSADFTVGITHSFF